MPHRVPGAVQKFTNTQKELVTKKVRFEEAKQTLDHLKVKIAEQKEVVQRVSQDQSGMQLAMARTAAFTHPSPKAPYAAVRLSFALGANHYCLSVAPGAKSGASAWNWDTCAASSYDSQVFLHHRASGTLRLADDAMHTRVVASSAGFTTLMADAPRPHENTKQANHLSFKLPAAKTAGPMLATDAKGKAVGCLKYFSALDDLVLSPESDSSAPCLAVTVIPSSLKKECKNIPTGQDNKLSELHELYTTLSRIVKQDVAKMPFFVNRVSEVDKAGLPKAGQASTTDLSSVKSHMDSIVTRNKQRRHKSVFLEEQEILFASVQLTEDKDDLVRLLKELLERMHEYLESMSKTLKTESFQCKQHQARLEKQFEQYQQADESMTASILPVKDSLAEDQNQFTVVKQTFKNLKAETTALKAAVADMKSQSVTADPTAALAALKLVHAQQLQALETLRTKLAAVLEKWGQEQRKVESGVTTYSVFPYEGVCNDTQSWATSTVADRATEDLTLVGGCVGCVASCPDGTAQRSFKLAQCQDGGLKIAHRCQRPANALVLGKATTWSNKCDAASNWGVGMSGAENLIRLGGAPDAISTCPAGAIVTGWGIQTCTKQGLTGLQFVLNCAATKKKVTTKEVLGSCTDSDVQAWGTGTHYAWSHLSQMGAPACPEGSFVSGLGVRHCDDKKTRLRLVAECSTLSA